MKRPVIYLGTLALAGLAVAVPLTYSTVKSMLGKPGWNADKARFTMPNGWRVTPAGKSIVLPGDMPGNILVLADGKRALVNTCGFHNHSLNLIDLGSGQIIQSIEFPRAWMGMAQTAEGILLSGGAATDPAKFEALHRIELAGDTLTAKKGLQLPGVDPKVQYVSGITAGPNGTYVLNAQSDEVLLLGANGQEKARAKVGYRPYAAALSPDRSTLAVSNWGDKSVSILDATTLALKSKVTTASLPSGLSFAADGRLFVANSGGNTVSVIRDAKVIETLRTGIDRKSEIGSSPVAVAISPDAKILYVANAGNNCVTVLDISNPKETEFRGYIPTARYPSALALTPDGKKLLIATAKGYYGPNAGAALGPSQERNLRGKDQGTPFQYIGNQLTGHLAIVDVPDTAQLATYSKQVLENAPLGVAQGPSGAERRDIERNAFRKIKHVIYVIRENRTFDQVLGDIGRGNADPSLTVFGKQITPNGHQFANTFALFDNLYADGETSQVGHQWTDAAYANDYDEKQMITAYSRRDEIHSDSRLVSSPGEYIWTQARKKGLSARVYGEYVDVQEDHGSLESEEIKRDPEKFGYSASFEKIFARNGRDTEKVEDFLKEMFEAEKTGKWHSLMVMALPEDHTDGFSAGRHSPRAMIANNDVAIGRLVDAVSHSKFWKETAIFIIQDDAQDGPDHVDSHRTVGYVVSPYIKRGVLDSTHYSTASMLRTMGLMLGLPPLTQYDAKATPMYAAFTTKPNFASYTVIPAQVDVEERNPAKTALAKRSAKLDFSKVDRADWGELNEMLWIAYKPGVPYPGPTRGR